MTKEAVMLAISLSGKRVLMTEDIHGFIGGLPVDIQNEVLLSLRERGFGFAIPNPGNKGKQPPMLQVGSEGYWGAGESCGLFTQHLPKIRAAFGLHRAA